MLPLRQDSVAIPWGLGHRGKRNLQLSSCRIPFGDNARYDLVADLRMVTEEDICPHCGGKLIFKLKDGVNFGLVEPEA